MGVVDTSSKFSTGIIDTGGVSLRPAAILPLVSLAQVVHLILKGLGEGEVIHEKPEAKFSWHCPFKPGKESCKTWIITQILLPNDTFEPYIWNQHNLEKLRKNKSKLFEMYAQGLFSKNRKFC